MGFFFPTEHLYGLPGREFDFDLKTTEDSGPYRLFNRDLDPHWPRNRTELYGSIPYVTGHATDFDSSVAWLNSADTWVEVLSKQVDGVDGSYVDFTSEGGMLEFLMFGSTQHPGRVQKQLADATGYLALPPINTLGFQFSKWAPVSADMITERSKNFTDYGFPVDVFWLDIEHALWTDKETIDTRDYRWFTFNPYNFTESSMDRMKKEIEAAGRRLVTIIDPHINANKDYFVYADGLALQDSEWAEDDAKNIFVRDEQGKTLYAEAWPGNSTFMDFLNANAREFWKE